MSSVIFYRIGVDRKTVAILLAMVIPGAGHIYYDPAKRRKGFGISIVFVILTFISYQLLGQYSALGLQFAPVFITWVLQLRAVMRFGEVPPINS